MTANTTPQDSQEDYGDLLLGLEDGDLNDFDGLDDFGDDLDEACEQMHRSQKEAIQRNDHGAASQDPFFNGDALPPTNGFTSGHGRPVAPPSSAALERVKKMFAEVELQPSQSPVDSVDIPNKRRKIGQAEEEEDIPDIPAPDFVMMESKGFLTGKGKAVPPPSKAAVEKAMKIIAAVEEEKEEFAGSPSVLGMSITTGNGNAVTGPSSTGKMFGEDQLPNLTQGHANMATPVKTTGFTTGSGAPASMGSEAARRKAMAMFGEDESTSTLEAGPSQVTTLRSTGFTTGSGSPAPMVSEASRRRALAMFGEDDPTSTHEMDTSMATPIKTTGFTTGSGATAPMASEAARRKAMAMFGEDDSTGSPSRPATSMLPPTSTPFRPLVQFTSTPQRPSTNINTISEFRTPLRTTTNIPLSQSNSTLAKQTTIQRLQPIEIKTPAPQRRVGLGRTPTSTKTGGGKAKFSTPFKAPSQSTGSPLKPATSLRTSNAVAGPSGLSRAATPAPVKEASVQVFDLTKPPDRKNMKDAYLHPQFNPTSELKELGFPDEIWLLDLTNAGTYQFIAEDGSPLNRHHAFTIIHRDGCVLISQKWVDNHWGQILWKIAGQVQAKPSLFDEKWNWGEVIAQLKYRYEREYGNAQRPIIRRIQEHDSSPSLPMILVVAAIHHPGPSMDPDEKDAPPPRPYLELSDGWYKILAEIDDCLARAINTGKIRVGRKLAISGAKLDSGSEGADVLEAFDKSRLIISGNSTSMARWHSRLGIQSCPFVAGLPSLTNDGGLIVLMDVVIEKLYPIAYMWGGSGFKEAPWDESEESIRSDAWRDKYQNESSSLREKMRKQLESIEDLVETLCSAAQDIAEPVDSNPPETLDRDFDILVNSINASAKIRGMSNSDIVHLATYARQRLQQEMTDGDADIERELQTACPARDIRDFRMAKIIDAREGDRDATRYAMLNIWDAKQLGDGSLREGGRYLVSGLMPGKSGQWGIPVPKDEMREIYLNTRRDTRWQEVGGDGGTRGGGGEAEDGGDGGFNM